jgi:hypothetical protein
MLHISVSKGPKGEESTEDKIMPESWIITMCNATRNRPMLNICKQKMEDGKESTQDKQKNVNKTEGRRRNMTTINHNFWNLQKLIYKSNLDHDIQSQFTKSNLRPTSN